MSFFPEPMMTGMAMAAPSPYSMEAQKKRSAEFTLPQPLNASALMQCLQELPTGTARAVESCVECFKNKRMSNSDLISFMRSIASQSAALRSLFAPPSLAQCEVASENDLADLRALAGLEAPAKGSEFLGEVASLDDMNELMAMAATPAVKAPAPVAARTALPAPAAAHQKVAQDSSAAARPSTVPQQEAHAPAAKAASAPRVRRMKVTEPSDEEKRLMEWWSARRVPEVRRRQTESADCNATMTEAQKTSAYLQYAMGELRQALPTAGKKRLLELVQSFNSGAASSEVLGAAIKDLVDEHSVVASLHHAPECVVRAPVIRKIVTGKSAKSSAAMTVAPVPETMDDSDELFGGYDDLLTTNIQPVKLEDSAGVPKRKRTETLNGCEPRNEEDEDNAMCPVCSGNPLDDDRWVKCDGCSSWYHQICVLFNEMAHGKSVRFFCRTPGCRKRGSRQLNRRQRKPCYPSSPQMDSSELGDFVTKYVQPASRHDRDVQVKLVANVPKTRQVKGARGRKFEETVQSKTLMAFQHTMIGSDLLFFTMCFDEVRSADGTGWVEINSIDSNGLYEELNPGEMAQVEAAVLGGYLEHAKKAGFTNARIRVQSCADSEGSMFYCRPTEYGWNSLDVALTACTEYLDIAHTKGVVLSHEQEMGEGHEEIVLNAVLNSEARPVPAEKDSERPLTDVASRAEIYSMMQSNNYRFDSLQFAKFSSMMVVYHVIKGWKKEQNNSNSATSSSKPMQAISVEDSMMRDQAPSPDWAPVTKKAKVEVEPAAQEPAPREPEFNLFRQSSHELNAQRERPLSSSNERNNLFTTVDDMMIESISFEPQMPALDEDTYWDNFLGMLTN